MPRKARKVLTDSERLRDRAFRCRQLAASWPCGPVAVSGTGGSPAAPLHAAWDRGCQDFLYFFPEPHGHRSLWATFFVGAKDVRGSILCGGL
jgi:hypothetical protein